MKKRLFKIIGISVITLILIVIAGFVGFYYSMGYAKNSSKVEFVYKDLTRFTDTYQQLLNASSTKDSLAIIKNYLNKGGSAFQSFKDEFNLKPERILKSIQSHSKYYESLNDIESRVRAQEAVVKQALETFKEMYPRAIFPPVHYFVAGFSGGGTAGYRGILIPVESYALQADTDSSEFIKGVGRMHPVSHISHFVIHELVHFNQVLRSPIAYNTKWNNLARAIKEGSADFIAYLAGGNHINEEAHAYGNKYEAELWALYQKTLDTNETGDWYWVTPKKNKEWPKDLGYFVGFKIAEAYYNKADDKQQAIEDMIEVSDYEKLLERSDYSPR